MSGIFQSMMAIMPTQSSGIESITRDMMELDLWMMNFDNSIDEGLEDALRLNPATVNGQYAGANFYAKVWFDADQFHAEVWVCGSVREVVSEDSLQDIMGVVCALYGAA